MAMIRMRWPCSSPLEHCGWYACTDLEMGWGRGQESGPPPPLKHWHLLLSHSKGIKINIGTISPENKIIFRIPSPGIHFLIRIRDVTKRLWNVREYIRSTINDPGEILYGSSVWIDLGHGYVSSEKQAFKNLSGVYYLSTCKWNSEQCSGR